MSFGIFLSCSILRLLPPPAGWTKCPEVGRGGRAPGFGTLCPSGGVARKADFILPLAAGNGKSLTTPYPCPGAGCGSAPVCGGPCKRCCPPLAEKWVKKWPSSGAVPVSGQSVGVRLSGPRKGDRRRAGVPILGAGGVSGVSQPRKGCSPLDGAQRRRNGGLLPSAIRRFASQSTSTHGR